MARRVLFALLVGILVLPLAGDIAMAHATYVKSNPAADARLAKSPDEIRITFSETPDAKGSDIAVLDTSGGESYDLTSCLHEPWMHEGPGMSRRAPTLRPRCGAHRRRIQRRLILA